MRALLVLFFGVLALVAQGPGGAPAFAFVGLHGGVYTELERAASELGIRTRYCDDDALAARRVDLATFDAVFVQHLRPDAREPLGDALAAARKVRPKQRAVMLGGEPPSLSTKAEHAGLLTRDTELQAYYGTTKENLRRLLVYARVRYGDGLGSIEPPLPGLSVGIWHPERPQLEELASFHAWSRARGRDPGTLPTVVVAVHSTHLAFQQPEVVGALLRRLEAERVVACAVVDTSEGLAAQRGRYEALMHELAPAAVIHTCHSTDTLEFRKKLDVPHLHSIFFRKKSIDAWYESPDGIDASESVFQVATQEVLGAIEPQVGAGTKLGGGSAEAFSPIPERIDHLVRRTMRWVALRTKRAADKKVAVVYWDRSMDKSGLMRGSATGMHLNAPRSLLAFFARLGAAGWRVEGAPTTEAELVAALLRGGRQIALHDRAGLAELVHSGDPILVPVARYEAWLGKRVSARNRALLEERWGKAPGRFMVWRDAQGAEFLVVPRLDFGGVVMLPQPLRGEANDASAVHDKKTCPPHHYLATYFWLLEEAGVDALVHFGTHGTELALPGKSIGLSDQDWPDVVLGDLPNLNPWIVENLGEAAPAKRRAYAVLVGHAPPPVVGAGLADGLATLHEEVEKWRTAPEGALRLAFAQRITDGVRRENLARDLHVTLGEADLLTAEQIEALDEYLHAILEEKTPTSLHVLGEAPPPDLLCAHLVTCLGKRFLASLRPHFPAAPGSHDAEHVEHLRPHAELVVRGVVAKGLAPREALLAAGATGVGDELAKPLGEALALARTLAAGYAQSGRELDALVEGLAGRFVAPGPGRGPDRNPAVLPTGRNLFQLNPEEVPSRASFELGKALAERMLAERRERKLAPLTQVAFSLSSFATFQDHGVMEAQILWLLGCEPVWDERNLVREVRLVPRDELGRARVDVFLAALSYYRDNLPSRMALLDKAVRLAAASPEADNPVRRHAGERERALVARGVAPARAELLARARIFGYAPGLSASPSYYYLVERSGEWEQRGDLMATYMSNVSHVYTEGAWGEAAREAYEETLKDSEVVLRTWYDSTTSPLANKYTWFTGGSLALAIETLSGKRPEYLLTDVRDPDAAKLVTAEDAVRMELRVRLFNRKWIEGMQREGYAGADQVHVMTSNLFGWETMRSGAITKDVWDRVKSIYLDDELRLGMREWFEKVNPHALQALSEVLLEAARKGYWQADAATLRDVAGLLAASEARHGPAGGIRDAGTGKTRAFTAAALADGTRATVAGKKLLPIDGPAPFPRAALAFAVAFALVLIGFLLPPRP